MTNIKDLKINLEQKILCSNNVVLVPHNGADFDAIASSIGISQIVSKLGKKSVIVVDDPAYKIDPGVGQIINEVTKQNSASIINRDRYIQMKHPNDLYVLTDVNKSYLMSLKDEIKRDNTIIIDHHDEDDKTVEAFFKYIDTNVSSASEIVSKLLCMFKIKPSSELANYLLSGIYLDTNKFTKNVSSNTMKIISKLLECGADMNRVTDLFVQDFKSDRRVQDLVSKAEILSYSIATVLAEENVEYSKEELAKVADYLLNYGVDASFAIGNIGDGIISISARAKAKVNVGEVMKLLGGGGNRHSAATKLTDTTIEEAGKRLKMVIQTPCYTK